MKSQVHRLDLIYPPVTNQEAEWLRDNKEVKEQLKYSNLYFVAQKPETFFQLDEKLSEILEQKKIIKFKYISGNSLDEVSIVSIRSYPGIKNSRLG
jgi:protoheme ferro-lyase